jgi:hypothetical protein
MTELPLSIKAAAAALRGGQITSVDLTAGMLDRIEHLNPRLGAFIAVTGETAMEAARQADVDLARGLDKGPLQGIPLGVKDIIATDNAPTTAQSLVLDPTWGDRGDAPVVARLRSAGAVIIGKTTTMEFATGMPDPDKPSRCRAIHGTPTTGRAAPARAPAPTSRPACFLVDWAPTPAVASASRPRSAASAASSRRSDGCPSPVAYRSGTAWITSGRWPAARAIAR